MSWRVRRTRPGFARRVVPTVVAVATVAAAGAFGVAWSAPAASDRAGSASASALGPAAQDTLDGHKLAGALGCGACHAGMPPADGARAASPPFGPGAAPLAPAYVFHYLADPQPARPGIAPARMPAYDLEEAERVALALFVTNETEGGPAGLQGVDDAFLAARARRPDVDRQVGRALFGALGCAGCHDHAETEPPFPFAPDLSMEGARAHDDWLRDYLARPVPVRPAGARPGRGGRMPDFRLEPGVTRALARYLAAKRAVEAPSWTPRQLSPFAMAKAETLLREQWSCLGCHRLGDDGGRVGPPLDGIAQRLRPEYVRALIADPSRLAPHAIMPGSFEQPDRLDLIASFLLRRKAPWRGAERVEGVALRAARWQASRFAQGQPPDAQNQPPDPSRTSYESGRTIYESQCAPCHGEDGGGDGFNAPFLPAGPQVHRDGAVMSLVADDALYDGIYAGGRIMGKSHRMPAFGPSLDDAELRATVAYVRRLCQCSGPAWSTDGRRR